MKVAQLAPEHNYNLSQMYQSIPEIDPNPFRTTTPSSIEWSPENRTIDNTPFIGCVSSSALDELSTTIHIQSNSSLSSLTYTNCIFNSTTSELGVSPYTERNTATLCEDELADFSSYSALNSLPLFFGSSDLVKVPSKIIYSITEKIPKKVLRQVHPEQQVAVELCLMYASQLTSTYFELKADSHATGWKSLNSKYLMKLVETDSTCYKRIRTVLEHELPKGAIMECDYKKVSGEKNYHYKFGNWYMDKEVHAYKLKTDVAKKFLYKHYLKAFARASDNIICRNLFHLYANIELPTIEQIEIEATKLIKEGFKNKKGKVLKRRNKHADSYFKNIDEITFVEDAVEIYKYLTNDRGIRIPTVGTDASGGRVVDSFTLMPSWIRNMVTINGNRLVECDYSCLHPNIAMHLYGGSSQFLTHQQLAEYLQMDVLEVKIEHLSFFNAPIWQMKQSPLWKYYEENELMMLENLISEKACNFLDKKDRHKITSRRLFKKEVEIMTDAIEVLNNEGIYVMYVYDALYSEERHKMRVQQVMNEVALEHSVYTQAKC